MSRYNHFSKYKYKRILFLEIAIGEKFRQDFFSQNQRRTDIICKKTGLLSFIEVRNKREHILLSAEGYLVSDVKELTV